MTKTTIGNVATVLPGFAFKSKDLTDQGVPVIKIGSITEDGNVDLVNSQKMPQDKVETRHERYRLRGGDIVMSMTGEGKIGRMADESDALLNQRVCSLRPTRCTSDYLWHALRASNYATLFQQWAKGAAQANISGDEIASLTIQFHEDETTRETVAETLSAYDTLIANNRRRIELLEQAARMIYKEWFVRFRFPGHEHVKIKNGIPEGWCLRTFDEITESVGGGTPSSARKEYWENGTVTWLTPTDITRNKCLVILDSERKITEDGLRHSSARLVPAHTILMTSRASVGFFALADFEVSTNQGFINIIPNNPQARYYILFNLQDRVDEIRSLAGGATYAEISKGKFRAMPVVVPTDSLLEMFDEITTPVIEQVRVLKKEINCLTTIRDILLPRLMNGAIQV